MKTISILVVDDSAVVRKALTGIIEATPDFVLSGAAADPIFAMKKMGENWPDVIILDIEMPRMDGLTFLKKIMAERPTPIIICSSVELKSTNSSLDAISMGAVAVIAKPKIGVKSFLHDEETRFVNEIRAAAQANINTLRNMTSGFGIEQKSYVETGDMQPITPSSPKLQQRVSPNLVAIGASTGGTQALEYLLKALTVNSPPIVIVQHMPEKFTSAFARRLNDICKVDIKEAEDFDGLKKGAVFIAPGGKHMELVKNNDALQVRIKDGPMIKWHRPSVDILFRSVAKFSDYNTLGIIMTGMGDDGAAGLLAMKNTGAHTLAQDEASCVVYGMPQVAVAMGAADEIITLQEMPAYIDTSL